MRIFRSHRHIKPEVLSEYLDLRLQGKARERVDAQLASCQVCREELESLRATVVMLRQLPVETLRRTFLMAARPIPVPSPLAEAGRAGFPTRPYGSRGLPLPLRMPQWVYAGAASVAMLALAVIVSADATGVLDPQPQAASREGLAADRQAGPEATASSDASEGAPGSGVELGRSGTLAVAPVGSTSEPGATPGNSRTNAVPPQKDETAAPAPPPAFAPGDPAAKLTPAAQASTEMATPAAPPATEPSLMAVGPTVEPQPQSSRSEDGSERENLAGQRSGAVVLWRVLEGVAAVLGLTFLIGLVLKRRMSRWIVGV
jgi:anti-sigma factor RsiW